MSSKTRTAKQAAKDRAALKRLRDSGTYSGKIDLRKAPTRYQLQKIAGLKGKRKSSKKELPPATKTPGASVKRSTMTEKQVRELKPATRNQLITYALPFKRRGSDDLEWRRFTHAGLNKFLNEYKSDDPEGKAEWKQYAVREVWTFDKPAEKTDMRRKTELYFSGVRISEPQGGVVQKRKPNKKGHRGQRKGK